MNKHTLLKINILIITALLSSYSFSQYSTGTSTSTNGSSSTTKSSTGVNANTSTTSTPTSNMNSTSTPSSKVNSTATSTSVSTSDDTSLTTSIQAAINTNSNLSGSNIRVTSNQGVITLEGTAQNQAQVDAAIQAVKCNSNVKDVKSNIKIVP